ncbi:MAG: N-acetyltransferase [Deltaproteobacteria bacterium]|nr:N-acetyltransferase [Deltaproteobacteria bacterium]
MNIRKAVLDDAQTIFGLVEIYAKKGEMLPRPISEIYSQIRDFFVCVNDDGVIIGAVALHVCWETLGEVRSLVVDPNFLSQGVGTTLVNTSIEDGKKIGLKSVFALTYSEDFFSKLGFKQVDKDTLPHKIWGECVKCLKFPNCDETAVLKEI